MVWVFVRQLVSMQRKRYVAEGYDLDLSYINERLLAMSYPAESGLEVVYRNPIWQVQRFLDLKHYDHYKVRPCYPMVRPCFKGDTTATRTE